MPLLRAGNPPKLVVLSQSADSYYDDPRIIRFESSIISSRAVREITGTKRISDHISLVRIYEARHYIEEIWLRKLDLDILQPRYAGFMPAVRTEFENNGTPETDANRRHLQSPSLERQSTISELARIAEDREFELVVVIPEVREENAKLRAVRHARWLRTLARELHFEVIEASQIAELKPEHFVDYIHLEPQGARIFSRSFGDFIENRVFARDRPSEF